MNNHKTVVFENLNDKNRFEIKERNALFTISLHTVGNDADTVIYQDVTLQDLKNMMSAIDTTIALAHAKQSREQL